MNRFEELESLLKSFGLASEYFQVMMRDCKFNMHDLTKQFDNLEGCVRIHAMELCRHILQDISNYRASIVPIPESIVGADDIERKTIKSKCIRKIESIFGEITISRDGLTRYGSQALFPVDANLNLPKDKYSYGLKTILADNIAKSSFDESISTVSKITAGKIPKRQAEEIAVEISQDFNDFYESGMSTGVEQTENPLVLSLDGKGIVMIENSLRKQTKKAAIKEKTKQNHTKLKTKISPAEKLNRKRMATVATVYTVEKHFQSPESIVDKSQKPKTKKPRPINKRVWASLEQDAAVVCDDVFQEALRRDPNNKRPWVVLVDGQPHQLNNINYCIKEHGIKNVTCILDIIHVIQYLWNAADCLSNKIEEKKYEWVSKYLLLILQGKVSKVITAIKQITTKQKLSGKSLKTINTTIEYFTKYSHMMQYDSYLKEGFQIATGAIEGACRHLVKDRMDITGARWGLKTAEAVLRLRALKSSGDLEEYFKFYQAKSHQRNHLSRYKDFPLPIAA